MLLCNMDLLLGIIYVSHTNLIKLISQVYDRRTPNAKKKPLPRSFLDKRQRASLDEDAAPSDASHAPLSPPPATRPVSISHTSPWRKHARASFFPGDLVVADSTAQDHALWFAKVMSCTDMEARLMHLVLVDGATPLLSIRPALLVSGVSLCLRTITAMLTTMSKRKSTLRTPRSAVFAHPVDEK